MFIKCRIDLPYLLANRAEHFHSKDELVKRHFAQQSSLGHLC